MDQQVEKKSERVKDSAEEQEREKDVLFCIWLINNHSHKHNRGAKFKLKKNVRLSYT